MKINYHIHTSYSGDMIREGRLSETPEKYVEAAIQKGFSEICFTDHVVVGRQKNDPLYGHAMDIERIPEYVREIKALAEKYISIRIRIGIELDWLPEASDETKAFIKKFPFDCVLGSVHVFDGYKTENVVPEKIEVFWSGKSDEEIYARHVAYYRALQEMAKSGIFDVVAHLDAINRDGYVPKKSFWPLIEETVDVIAKAKLCVEVNTKGLKKPIKKMHPSPEILALCKKKGIPVTIGTDAHWVNEIDLHYEKGINLIRSAGYDRLAVFEGRKMRFVKI
ncbi:MAG: histidinol-phosphatase HisJ family protein [Candidatus Aenigmarchaeota archaeon]|nr:histidinol-phosphatase HisJ family protein [Candidatus Aenigmarchaeota archaeon]